MLLKSRLDKLRGQLNASATSAKAKASIVNRKNREKCLNGRMSTSLNVHRANVTKNLMRLQPARFPFLCKEAYPRIRGATLQHVVRKTKWDIKQSLFNQRAAYEEG